MGCAPAPPPAPAAPEPGATPPAEPDPATSAYGPAPRLRGIPVTLAELLGSLEISPEGGFGGLAVV
jgi:hypothetical protein